MPPITRAGLFRACKIWIDVALGGAARCRRVALRQRRVAAFVIVGPPAVHMQANRISGIVRLGPSRCHRQGRCDRQNRQSRNAHSSHPKCLLHCVLRSGLGRIFRPQADRPPCSQSIHVRALGRAQYRFGGGDVRHVHQHFLGAVHVEYLAAGTLPEAVRWLARSIARRLKPLASIPQRIFSGRSNLSDRATPENLPRCALIETPATRARNRRGPPRRSGRCRTDVRLEAIPDKSRSSIPTGPRRAGCHCE
jgi:hypothetical protein